MFLKLAFLFFIGSVAGWLLEVVFRRFFSRANPEHKWINPGFCTGPYVPLYGVGLCILYLIALLEGEGWISDPVWNRVVLFAAMAVAMTAIEYIAGILVLKIAKVRLWDYSREWGNFQGIICPRFSFFWAVLGAVYYFLIHPYILEALDWLARNLAFSFVIGMFFGIFILDVAHSVQLVNRLKQFAEENDVIVRFENIKTDIRSRAELQAEKYHFFRPFHSKRSVTESLREMTDTFERRIRKSNRKKEG
ncbi:MAG: putative ABC transporter permease [Firmicutes bacterium]|nr:putative ABC transporter permease [Bacillota bacterium]